MEPVAVYLHIPFCQTRCGYCDFNTYAGVQQFIPAYVDALCREIEQVAAAAPAPLAGKTVFFGGGTPSLLSSPQISQILRCLSSNLDLSGCAEISLEANPGTVDEERLAGFLEAGVNRLSLGMQSANPAELSILDRQHQPGDVQAAVAAARNAGFANISLDLIYGIPGQDMDSWLKTLRAALELLPEHLSLYCLTVEEGTPLEEQIKNGSVQKPDDDLAADLFTAALELLNQDGFERYEISNFAAKRGGLLMTCAHNLTYWRNQPYLGFGAGAHGCADKVRTANVKPIPAYLSAVTSGKAKVFPAGPAAENIHCQSDWEIIEETMMLGLRLTGEGISARGFQTRFGRSIESLFPRQIQHLTARGLVEWDGETLRLSQQGSMLGNQVFLEFVGNRPPPDFQ